jgi:hypothetical protein
MGGTTTASRLLVGIALALVAIGAAPAISTAAHRGGAVPPLYDRTYKCDALELLPSPPELVFFGGSRAQRFEPSYAEEVTGLPAFNFAVQNSRPADVYAMSRYLFWRAPTTRLRCVWALQSTTFGDTPFHPGLLAENRLNRFLPSYLVATQRALDARKVGHTIAWPDQYSERGCLLYSSYDVKLERGISFETSMAVYLKRMLPKAARPKPHSEKRSRYYFERTLRLFNLHDVEPVIVIMPYHPEVLAAFRAVGWGTKEEELASYLGSLQDRYRFHVLDYTEIESFGGSADEFYDGSHIKTVNARRILDQAVRDVPAAFR